MKHIMYTLFSLLITFVHQPGLAQSKPHLLISSSPSSSTFESPVSISFNASPYDQGATINRVEFYLCGTKIAETDNKPYNITLNDLSAGTYCITAKAFDNNDSSGISNSIKITVNAPPVSCESLSAYSENAGYTSGSKVANNGHQYECKPWPYSGWCNGASWAYEPGSGAYWTDAWTDLGVCSEETPEHCENIEVYSEEGIYGPGSHVSQNGIRYECRPWPYSGWCSGEAWAYAPGTGTHWQDAWIAQGNCSSSARSKKTQSKEVSAAPHPFDEETTVQLDTREEILSMELFNSQGIRILSVSGLHQKELSIGRDLASG